MNLYGCEWTLCVNTGYANYNGIALESNLRLTVVNACLLNHKLLYLNQKNIQFSK